MSRSVTGSVTRKSGNVLYFMVIYLMGIPTHVCAVSMTSQLSGGSLETINVPITFSASDAPSGCWKSTYPKQSRNGKN